MSKQHPIDSLLAREEGKTLEFKLNCSPLARIVRTTVAFANTAGGTILIGVEDETKSAVGVQEPLEDEERLANAFADSISPTLLPDIQIQSWRDRELIVVTVPHNVGPYYLHAEGPDEGVYIRLGSTNRQAGPELVQDLRRLARNTSFDEQMCTEVNSEGIDFRVASELFEKSGKPLTQSKRRSLRLLLEHGGKLVPTNGAVLLFGKERNEIFPDAIVRCARFEGTDRSRFLDRTEIEEYLPLAVESAISFVERNTHQAADIGRVHREEKPEYPPAVIREAVINAVVHADYSITGSSINLAVFDDRIEITNPGLLPFGLTLEAALSGVSRLRNRVIGRVFRELALIEQWGSGLNRMISTCEELGLKEPDFEELGTSFRVTLYSSRISLPARPKWEDHLMDRLRKTGEISTSDAAELWEVSARTARSRLKKLVEKGSLATVGTSPKDPHRKYVPKR